MAMKRCNNGHFYDDTKHSVCPFCGVQKIDISKTMPLKDAPSLHPQTPPMTPATEKTIAKGQAHANEGKTVGIMRSHLGFDPVVGWLVCIDGPDKGKDFRLKSEKNFIGRSSNMDVAISSDAGISRANHAVVSYNPRKNNFMLYPGESHSLVYLNSDEVCTPIQLNPGDCIEMGNTKLMFIPFCGEWFQWRND
ncbi:FHA domain-containing protein [Ructibacterium gallinarum]|uniref:FHA domain-containing protein n=1 Tax=Ructibacterium gallinarum TaxID=2779355 RepID=A0A9D5M0D4_9FIRM|nr:FHA domain-containing protein [Ructibacterium gallinarum]MBE5040327.1 FHA domain-containing protein [Ructibacterium gallinarum]